ncbi:cyclophilin-like fold protein [Mycobacterium sp. 852013-50091_SCH5140682]|uniref:cyclophilin-like fold protein n=1 Tax=Mycobacterium sp. 852013-50091_SCH5140682 TaxID=1834109 RepID=UPI0012E9EAE5|nr:cyclophilin-like fold protein [Mycobacterium sp. 852013-50091_SCH5140682]
MTDEGASFEIMDTAVLVTKVKRRLALSYATEKTAVPLRLIGVTGCALALALSGCTDDSKRDAVRPSSETSPLSTSPGAETTNETNHQEDAVTGTVVHFTAGSTVVKVTIHEDTPTARDFVSMLPMTLTFEDFNGMEKIAYPPRAFDTTDDPGMTPKVGDLFSYIPWGNLGFFYDTGSLGFSRQLVRIGSTDDLDAIRQLDGREVSIAVAPR